jgi:holo-[acyl-carrier protein] synthase
MAIVGLGIDLVEIARIDRILEKDDGFVFRKKVFSDSEIEYCEKSVNRAQHYAARWAAKEALIKALNRPDVAFRDMIVHRDSASGAPFFRFSEKTLSRDPALSELEIHLSLTHTRSAAAASVIAATRR